MTFYRKFSTAVGANSDEAQRADTRRIATNQHMARELALTGPIYANLQPAMPAEDWTAALSAIEEGLALCPIISGSEKPCGSTASQAARHADRLASHAPAPSTKFEAFSSVLLLIWRCRVARINGQGAELSGSSQEVRHRWSTPVARR